jgi:hypothetical protein
MLTLKIVTLDHNEEEQTSIFFGDSITHSERVVKISELPPSEDRYVGIFADPKSEQPFMSSRVMIFNADRTLKESLLILPKSDCFITESGKTVDTFHSYFKQV